MNSIKAPIFELSASDAHSLFLPAIILTDSVVAGFNSIDFIVIGIIEGFMSGCGNLWPAMNDLH